MAEPIVTARLVLAAVTEAVARAVLAGTLEQPAAGRGWPGPEAVQTYALALAHGGDLGRLVLLDGLVVGECGTHGPPRDGAVEIRYGIAPAYRCRGLATEACAALTQDLLERPGVERVVARAHVDNHASRRVLERCGFTLDRLDGSDAWYGRGA